MVVRLVAVAVVQQPVDVPISETERDEIPDRPHHASMVQRERRLLGRLRGRRRAFPETR